MPEPPPQFDYTQPPAAIPAVQGDFRSGICPACGMQARKVQFTWWGGVLGASLVPHFKCPTCKSAFSSKDGQPVTRQIVIYMTFSCFIPIAIVLFLVFYKLVLKR